VGVVETVTGDTNMDTTNIETLRALYADARFHGKTPEGALEVVWRTVRAHHPRLRAPSGVEAIGPLNTGRRRNYRSPLGEVLGIPGADAPYGQHSAQWRRTVSSINERDAVVRTLAAYFGEV
jgi:hypothetical protein